MNTTPSGPSSRSRKKRWLVVPVLAGVLVIVATGLYWREIRARWILMTQFEHVSEDGNSNPQYRHKRTGIVFEIVGDDGK